MSQNELRVDFCSYEAAKYAVMHWHYSKAMPSGKLVKFGVWENSKFIGAVLFGRGGNNNIGSRYEVSQVDACELVRVALCAHVSPVSKIVSCAVKCLKANSPGLRMIVSYADPVRGHVGGVYQAMNWIYVGQSNQQRELLVDGKFMHKRAASAKWGTASPEKIRRIDNGLDVRYGPKEWKHTYLYPLDRAMRKQLEPLAKPYPKHAGEAKSEARPASSRETGGANPTRPLSETDEPVAVAAE